MTAPYSLREVSIGIDATGERHESDSMGTIKVPANLYWGAQTQRSLLHFSIGQDSMSIDMCRAYGFAKKSAAQVT